MYNINFLNKPGIQKYNNNEDIDVIEQEVKDESISLKNKIKPNENYISQFLIAAFVIIFSIFLYKVYINNTFSNDNSYQSLSLSYILKMLRLEDSNSRLIDINLINDDVRLILQCSDEECIYGKLDLLDKYNIISRASINKDSYRLFVNEKWTKGVNDDWNLSIMKKFIADFNGISSDFFNEKLIIVSDYSSLVSLFSILDEHNVINLFSFSVQLIDDNSNNNDYYKIIIEEYD
tara:strand:+ start:3781 stop:4482 length:702 start_codon:yes stop_codon:yes gene_type:complete